MVIFLYNLFVFVMLQHGSLTKMGFALNPSNKVIKRLWHLRNRIYGCEGWGVGLRNGNKKRKSSRKHAYIVLYITLGMVVALANHKDHDGLECKEIITIFITIFTLNAGPAES